MSALGIVAFIAVALCLVLGHLDIRRPPRIERGPRRQNVIYRTDDSIRLQCEGFGIPNVTYDWKKDGVELNLSSSNIHKAEDGDISIYPAKSTDEGFYQCLARNKYGTALSITAHAQFAFLESAAGSSPTVEKTVIEGQPFHIRSDAKKSFPKPTYGWEIFTHPWDENPVSLPSSSRIQIAENGDLHFAYALPEDALAVRIYRCTTYNPYLEAKAGGNYTKITVTKSSTGTITPFAPTLGFSSEAETVAVIGGSVTLRCFFYGNQEPTISWTGPRNTLPIGRYTLNTSNTELTISNITATDEGNYTCTASNTQGRQSHTLQIRVEEVPIFPTVEDGPYDVTLTEGESHTFNCNAIAKPEAKIVWLQDGVELNVNNLPRRFAVSDNKTTLTIKDVCRTCADREKQTDLTVIQCNASNLHGYAFASGYLNVLSRTKVLLGNNQDVSVGMYEDREVKFECKATSDPSTPPSVWWYRVNENNEQQSVKEDPPTVTVNDGLLTIHVNPNDTKKWTDYKGEYKCIGSSTYSQDSASVKLLISRATALLINYSTIGNAILFLYIFGQIFILS